MNFVDVLIIMLIIASAARGVEVGFARQFGSLAGLWVGILVGGWAVSLFDMHSWNAIVVIILCIVLGVVAGEMLGIKVKQLVHEHKANIADRILGAILGVVTCFVAIWLGSTLITVVTAQSVQVAIRDSAIIRYLDRSLPPATDAISSLETYFKNTGLPEIVKTDEPTLSGETPSLPDNSVFAGVVDSAKTATVEIEGRACSGIDIGSGFVTDGGLVVTNAHVVAGMRTPFIKLGHQRQQSQVVAFDPELDIAILKPLRAGSTSLALDTTTVPRNTPGLVLGYPGGGNLAAKPAVVADTFLATGKDIYGVTPVTRKIYALKADIQKGNSGGPLINKAGNVIGVIFARSTSYTQVGYALLSSDVAPLLEQAQTAPSAGQSLRCL